MSSVVIQLYWSGGRELAKFRVFAIKQHGRKLYSATHAGSYGSKLVGSITLTPYTCESPVTGWGNLNNDIAGAFFRYTVLSVVTIIIRRTIVSKHVLPLAFVARLHTAACVHPFALPCREMAL